MAAVLDHLLWGAPDLEAAVAAIGARTGVRPAIGGAHPELGTRNALASLGRRRFLEVIAPDPERAPGALARQLLALREPTLVMWAGRTADPAATVGRAETAGYASAVVDGHRARSDGTVVRWTNVFVTGHGAGTLVPFFIAWRTRPHPASDAPGGLVLRRFHVETPYPEALRVVLEALDVRVPVREGPVGRLVALLDTPCGRVELAGP